MKIQSRLVLLLSFAILCEVKAIKPEEQAESVQTTPTQPAPATSTQTPQLSPRSLEQALKLLGMSVVVSDASSETQNTSPSSSSPSHSPTLVSETDFIFDTSSGATPAFISYELALEMLKVFSPREGEQNNPKTLFVCKDGEGYLLSKYIRKASEILDVSSEQRFIKMYWSKLCKLVTEFVDANQKDPKSFFAPAMISLKKALSSVDDDVRLIFESGSRVFDSSENLDRVYNVVLPIMNFFQTADFYVWKVKMSEGDVIYPWDDAHKNITLDEEEGDTGKKNIGLHLEKMTSADKKLYQELPFVRPLSFMLSYLLRTSQSLKEIAADQPPFYGESKWNRSNTYEGKKVAAVKLYNNPIVQHAIRLAEGGISEAVDALFQRVDRDILANVSPALLNDEADCDDDDDDDDSEVHTDSE